MGTFRIRIVQIFATAVVTLQFSKLALIALSVLTKTPALLVCMAFKSKMEPVTTVYQDVSSVMELLALSVTKATCLSTEAVKSATA